MDQESLFTGELIDNDIKLQPIMLLTLNVGSRVLSSANISVAGSLEGHMMASS